MSLTFDELLNSVIAVDTNRLLWTTTLIGLLRTNPSPEMLEEVAQMAEVQAEEIRNSIARLQEWKLAYER